MQLCVPARLSLVAGVNAFDCTILHSQDLTSISYTIYMYIYIHMCGAICLVYVCHLFADRSLCSSSLSHPHFPLPLPLPLPVALAWPASHKYSIHRLSGPFFIGLCGICVINRFGIWLPTLSARHLNFTEFSQFLFLFFLPLLCLY